MRIPGQSPVCVCVSAPAALASATTSPAACHTVHLPGGHVVGVWVHVAPCVLQVRSIIAKRLLESKLTAPSLYVSTDVQLDQLTALRKTLAEQVWGWVSGAGAREDRAEGSED